MNVQALIMAKSQQMNSKQWSIFLACFQNDQLTYITLSSSVLLDGLNLKLSVLTGFRLLAKRMKIQGLRHEAVTPEYLYATEHFHLLTYDLS